MTVVLTDEQANELLNYLGTRPYVEVAALIATIVEAREPDPEPNGRPEQPKSYVTR